MTSVRFSVRFGKKPRFSAQFRFYQINCSFGFSVQFLHCVLFNVYALYWVLSSVLFYQCFGEREESWTDRNEKFFHLHLYGMRLEMTYFRAELVQPKWLRTRSAEIASRIRAVGMYQ